MHRKTRECSQSLLCPAIYYYTITSRESAGIARRRRRSSHTGDPKPASGPPDRRQAERPRRPGWADRVPGLPKGRDSPLEGPVSPLGMGSSPTGSFRGPRRREAVPDLPAGDRRCPGARPAGVRRLAETAARRGTPAARSRPGADRLRKRRDVPLRRGRAGRQGAASRRFQFQDRPVRHSPPQSRQWSRRAGRGAGLRRHAAPPQAARRRR